MKTLKLFQVILIPLLIISVQNSFAQNEFAPIGAKWYYSVPGIGGNPFDSVLIYEIIEDTLINDIVSKKIRRTPNEFYYMYQSETKVFFWQNEQFHLVYDFGVIIGDTCEFTQKALIPDQINTAIVKDTILEVSVIIDSISFIVAGEDSLRRFYSHYLEDTLFPQLDWNSSNYNYTEKLGGADDIINTIIGVSIPESNKIFRCYIDSLIYYVAQWWEFQGYNCDYYTKVINPIFKDVHIVVFPNPTMNYIEIVTEERCWIDVVDITGTNLISRKCTKSENRIDLSGLKIGVYILLIHNSKLKETIKIIKL